MLVEVSHVDVRFDLPLWFPPERCEYRKIVYYDSYHRWAGQVDHERSSYENRAVNGLFKLKDCHMTDMNPMCPHVIFRFDPVGLHQSITETKAKLERYLRRYRESRNDDTGTDSQENRLAS